MGHCWQVASKLPFLQFDKDVNAFQRGVGGEDSFHGFRMHMCIDLDIFDAMNSMIGLPNKPLD